MIVSLLSTILESRTWPLLLNHIGIEVLGSEEADEQGTQQDAEELLAPSRKSGNTVYKGIL